MINIWALEFPGNKIPVSVCSSLPSNLSEDGLMHYASNVLTMSPFCVSF